MTEIAAMLFTGWVLGVVTGVAVMWDRRQIDFHDDTEHGVGRIK